MNGNILKTRMMMVVGMMIVMVLSSSVPIASAETETADSQFKDKEANIKALFQIIDDDINKKVDIKKSSKELVKISEDIVKKHSKKLDNIINDLQTMSGITELDDKNREDLKRLIINQRIKRVITDLSQKEFDKNSNITSQYTVAIKRVESDKIEKGIEKGIETEKETENQYIANVAYLPLGTYYPIHYWIQPYVDITGGSGYDGSGKYYNINGGNGLYKIDVKNGYYLGPYRILRYTQYTLHYYDEDHPNPVIDWSYDFYRSLPPPIGLGRIEDIETFKVVDGIVRFENIWDEEKTFAEFYGRHGTINRNYYGYWPRIYVNVWNHALDYMIDRNPNMVKIYWYY